MGDSDRCATFGSCGDEVVRQPLTAKISMTAQLRIETAAAHAAIEPVVFPSLRSGARCLSGYQRFLQTMYAFHRFAEHVGVSSFAPDARALLVRSAMIRADADELGIKLSESARQAASDAHVTFENDELAGLAYVVAGSALGGQVVSRQLPAGLPRTYLTNAGRPVAPAWRSFTRGLDEATNSWEPHRRRAAAVGARLAFNLVGRLAESRLAVDAAR